MEPSPPGESALRELALAPASTPLGSDPSGWHVGRAKQSPKRLGRKLGAFRPSGEALALGGVVIFALVVRAVALGTLPPNVTADEADNLQVAYHIAVGQAGPGFFGLDWKPAPAFSVYLMTAFMYVFGWSIAGMRMASAVLTSLAIIPFYLVARQVCSAGASLAAAFLLSTGLWYLHFSRSGWENAQIGLFALLAAWSLTRGLQTRRLAWYALAGLWCALGFYGYFAGRAIVLSLLAYLPFALWQHRPQARRVVLGYAVMLLVCAIVFAPQVPSIVNNWDYFDKRTQTIAITSVQLPYLGARTMPEVFVGQIERTVRAFWLLDGAVVNNSRYFLPGKPIFDTLTAILFAVGLVAGAIAWRRLALWWCLMVVPLGVTQILSTGTPDLARAVGVAPVLYLFVAYGFEQLAPRPGSPRRVLQLAVVVLLPWAAFTNLSGYVNWVSSPEVADRRRPAVEVAEFDVWQSLQLQEAAAGRRGFTAGQWEDMRARYGFPLQTSGGQPAGTQPPPVGTPPPGMGTFEGTLADGLLAEPRGVAVGKAGEAYVVDARRRQVVKLGPGGNVLLSWGRQGTADGEFSLPWDVAVDDGGRVYVLDAEANQVQRFDGEGNFDARLLQKANLYHPRGIAVDRTGMLYVADTGRNRVLKVAPTGDVVATFAAGSGATLDQPTDVAVDANGYVYVAEPAAKRIVKLDRDGRQVLAWGLPPANTVDAPHLAVSDRWLFVSNPGLNRIDVYTLDGRLSGYLGTGGRGDGQLDNPMGVAVDPATGVFVADVRNARLQVFSVGG